LKRIRHDRSGHQSPQGSLSGPQAIAPPAFLFLFLRCQTARTEVPNEPPGSSSHQAEVAAYMGHEFPRQHSFLHQLQKLDFDLASPEI
ncbi:MAG: hypothetical protein AAFY43_05040, partial [Pseudomonadota bacterium]